MFIVTYTYKVPKNKLDQYLDLERRAKKVYSRHGCISYEVFMGDDDWCLEINRFRNKEHYESVKNSVDTNPYVKNSGQS